MHKGSRFLQTIHALRDCVVHQVEEITVITSLSCPLHHLPPTKEEVNVFARVPLSVCLSVCLSVGKITQKRVHGCDVRTTAWMTVRLFIGCVTY